jgi:protein O-GlcNAc transferase
MPCRKPCSASIRSASAAWRPRSGSALPRMASPGKSPLPPSLGDVVLDPPQASGPPETALPALRAGVPIVTLPGTVPARRQTAGLLGALGLHGFVAVDADDYVQIAAALAAPAARNYAARCIADALDRRAPLAPAARAAAFNAALRRFLATRQG